MDSTVNPRATSQGDDDIVLEASIMSKFGLPTSFTCRSTRTRNHNGWKEFLTDDMGSDVATTRNSIFKVYPSDSDRAFDRFWSQNSDAVLKKSWEEKLLHEEDIIHDHQSELYRLHCYAVYEEQRSKFLKKYNLGRKGSSTTSSGQTSESSMSQHEKPEELPAIVKKGDECDALIQEEQQTWNSFAKLLHENIGETEVESELLAPKHPPVNVDIRYWHQRYRLFSRFDEGIILDEESWYSVTPEEIAKHTAKRCVTLNKTRTIIDGFCGAGGNTIQFALADPEVRVIAVDIDAKKIELAKNNASVYGVQNQIHFIVGDFVKLIPELFGDVVFLSPPWGGPSYMKLNVFKLKHIDPPLTKLFALIREHITENIALLVPRNTYENDLRELAGGRGKLVEIEKNFCNKKVKMITAYFGSLISNQEPASLPEYFP